MISRQPPGVKKAQKESQLLRELANLFLQITMDDAVLRPLSILRTQLSPEGSTCTVYFYAPEGEKQFRELCGHLILYKPALRKALAASLQARYTPDLIFKYDAQFEKQKKVEDLIDKLKDEGQL
jgi:ribosome-binding factor A